MRHASLLAGTAMLLSACATGGAPDAARDAQRCVFHFDWYDIYTTTMPTERRSRGGGYSLSPAIQQQIALLRAGDCMTMTDDLAGLETFEETLRPFTPTPGATPIARTAMHAGVVTSMNDETRSVAFFEGLGYPVRTVGAQGLGRRVFVGPFTTRESLDEALSVARRAGFASAYPTRRIRF